MPRSSHPRSARLTLASIAILALALASPLIAQRPAAPYKGVWEPVSYSEDIELRDVFFVNVDVGWVVGDAGTILHTKDGGATWTAQLGGDRANVADPVTFVRFVDERTGWAKMKDKLLHTSDGEAWEEIGTLPARDAVDIAFTSRADGFAAGKSDFGSQQGTNTIYRTRDGGRTWKPVYTCTAKVMLSGLARELGCSIVAFHFPTPMVGYAVAKATCFGAGCEGPPLITKTEDGGETWRTMAGPGVIDEDRVTTLFFLDENKGFARLESGKLHATTDGGATWRGVVASPGKWLRFADPNVGWAYDCCGNRATLAYSTDGGARWNAREVRFPAEVNAMSFPRRDRAFAVGEHGMIYRYRIAPASYALKANDIASPAMPGFTSEIDEQVEKLGAIVQELGSALGVDLATTAASADPAEREASASESSAESLDAPLPAPSEFATNCCNKSFSRLEVILGALSATLPEFVGKYRNLNLLVAGIRMGADLPDQYRSVKGGLSAFRQAQDKEAAAAALAKVHAALSALKQTTAVSLQQTLPPPDADGGPSGSAGGSP